MKLSLSVRLTFGFLIVVSTTSIISAVVGAWMIGAGLSNQAQEKAKHDINAARLIYNQALGDVDAKVRFASLTPPIREALAARDLAALGRQLRQIQRREGLDFITVASPAGEVLQRASASRFRGKSAVGERLVRFVLAKGRSAATTMVVSPDDLRREDPALAERARVPAAAGTTGLVLLAAAIVNDDGGRPVGVVYGGKVLNRTTDVVDLIRQTIYQGEVYHGREVGQATIFLGEVRVATNLRMKNGKRAIGTRVERAVSEQVLRRGQPWVERASVLDERHITAYEPIRDISNRVVGILAVGIPERKYTEMRKDALLVFFGITLGGVVLAVGISTFISRRIARSIRGIVVAVQDLARGNLDRRVAPDTEIYEFNQVGEGFNRMAASLHERDLELKFRTQEQIGKSERLAMIGRLAAGVAHEINNPLGGIMLFSNLLLRKLPAEGPAHENAERICNEAKRCQKIVQGLLDFARHREPKVEPMDVHDVLDRTLQLVEKQAMFLNIETVKDYGADIRLVRADPGQLEQVFINLIFNAAEAMQGKGRLTISTEPVDHGDGVRLSFTDTGCGISADNLERLFEPFFTTKDVGHGTGLGLSVSRGIVENHGGSIWATSRVGQGTAFFIRLPTIPSTG